MRFGFGGKSRKRIDRAPLVGMGSYGISNGNGFSDLRLSLEQVGARVISTLARFEDSQKSLLAQEEYSPNWGIIASGIDVLQKPEDHVGETVAGIGEELGKAAFGPRIVGHLVEALDSRSVRLWLNPIGELAQLPWETCLVSSESGGLTGILSMIPGLSLIRDAGGVARPTHAKRGPTRVLVAWSDPSSSDYRHLPGIEPELRSVIRALSSPECRQFQVEVLQFATHASLVRTLGSFRPDIFHFIGHGDLLPTGGALVLESGLPNVEALLHGDELAKLLSDSGVQLAFLSGCMTGAAVCGVGAELARSGIPATVAMQGPFYDGSAGLFARAFYGSLGAGETVDDAVLEGRCTIRGAGNDWAVPIVMRVPFEGPRFDQEVEEEVVQEAPAQRHNLTYDERPFIGRATERLEVRDRVSVKRQRLVTVTGMGGMGKTRLGKQVSAELLDDFPDGVWMVECDALDGREQIVGAIATAIGISETGSDVEQAVIRKLASKKLLLFLDCFERHVDHADLLDSILKHSGECQILVTSRVVLGLPREFEYRLSPMAIKKKGAEPSDSVSLFAEAASHALNSFELTSANRAVIKELCTELEGVPLALLHAAGRLRHLSLRELLEQVRLHPLEVLRRRGGVKDRQADLYRVVASSFLLLGARECSLLDRLGVFVGSFYAEDAAEVCNLSKAELLNSLATLRDHSLIQVQTRLERTRFKLLDTVREFLNQLPRNESEEVEKRACSDRHAERYARMADSIGGMLREGRWSEGTELLWSEIGNIRAACNYSALQKRYDLASRFAFALGRPFFDMALYADFEQVAKTGLEAARTLGDLKLEALLLGLEGAQAAVKKDDEACRELWVKRLEICRAMGDLEGSTDALCDLAWESFELGRIQRAREELMAATEIASKASHQGLMARCFVERAQIDLKAGDVASARELVAEATQRLSHSEHKGLKLYVNQHLVALNEALGNAESAFDSCVQMLVLAFEVHRYRNTAWALLKLGELHETAGELESAVTCFVAAVRLQAEFASRQGERSKAILSQFEKRHEDLVRRFLQDHKRTSWRNLIRTLSYVKDRAA